jgi:hypothetical protein
MNIETFHRLTGRCASAPTQLILGWTFSSVSPRVAVITVALALSTVSCTTAPVDQIKNFSQAFNTVNTVGQPLLDDLAVAERKQGQQIAVRRAKDESPRGAQDCPPDKFPWKTAAGNQGIIRGFCLNDAAYFSLLTDPPATGEFRGALSVIERYAEVLSTLAEGRNIEGAVGQIDALGKNVSGLLDLVGVAGAAAGPIGPALAALKPILETAARQANTAEAKRLILEGAPKVTALIGALKQAAPSMFMTLIEALSARLDSEPDQTPSVAAVDIAQIEAYRITVANYVVLLGKMQSAWDLTVAAASAPPNRVDLATVVQQTAELRSDAEAARRAFAILRTAGAATPTK